MLAQIAYWMAIQIFRAWVALRLGMPKTNVKTALADDNVTQHIQLIERG